MEKLIITAALTGAVTMPVQTPYLPLSPKEVADEAVRAAEAGAASVHIHARSPEDGSPSAELEIFREIITQIKEKSNVVICITTGGSLTATREERIRVVPTFKPELASFNMGSINFSIHPMAERYEDQDYKYSWEKGFVEMTKDVIFRNTFADLESRAHRRLRPVKPGGSTVTPEGEPYESRARLLFFCPAQCGSLRKFPIFSNVHFGQELSGLPQLRVSTGDAQGEVSAANAAAPYGRRRHTQHVPRTGLHQGCFTSRPPCSWLHF